MPTPRVAAIHDMSGFGRCSLTVAIPVLSAMGVQCCPLPTAYLSTHTGGFTGYTFLDMTDELPKTAAHWAELGIHFDAVYTGFMGSEAQMDLAADFVRTFRRDRSTIFICDPVMGDHGKIYKTYTPAMCAGMTRLAELADVIVPNLTEAAVLLGEDHSFGALTHDEAGYRSVVERLSRNGTRSVVLTGVMGLTAPEDGDGRTPGERLRQDKTLALPDSTARVEWLTKETHESDADVLRWALSEDIHKFSMVPDLTDEQFAANASGVAMRYKLLGLEQLTGVKERYFREGLRCRVRLFAHYLALLGEREIVPERVRFIFTRSLPVNDTEQAQIVRELHGIVPDEQLLPQLSFLRDFRPDASQR